MSEVSDVDAPNMRCAIPAVAKLHNPAPWIHDGLGYVSARRRVGKGSTHDPMIVRCDDHGEAPELLGQVEVRHTGIEQVSEPANGKPGRKQPDLRVTVLYDDIVAVVGRTLSPETEVDRNSGNPLQVQRHYGDRRGKVTRGFDGTGFERRVLMHQLCKRGIPTGRWGTSHERVRDSRRSRR